MKKTLIITTSIIAVLFFGVFLIYQNLPQVASFLLSRDFGFPIKIKELHISKTGLKIQDLQVFNLKPSPYDPALSCKTIKVATTLKKLRQKRLTIDEILLNQIGLNIQFYDSAKEKSNFNEIIGAKTPTPEPKEQKPYLIKRLVLNDLKVKLIFANGKIQDATIDQLVFTNISEKSGFPIEQLEKAILHAIIRSIFEKYGIKNILRTLEPQNLLPNLVPQNIIPKSIPFF